MALPITPKDSPQFAELANVTQKVTNVARVLSQTFVETSRTAREFTESMKRVSEMLNSMEAEAVVKRTDIRRIIIHGKGKKF